LNYGGYPEAIFSTQIQKDPAQYIKNDIIDKVLLRDLPSLYGISDIQELNRLFTVLAYNSGSEMSLDTLTKHSGVTKATISKYLQYLEASFLIIRVDKVDQNAKRFKRATNFKIYLTNPSMRAALFGQIKDDSESMGAMAETAIFSQWHHNHTATLFYARWSQGEVDIVYIKPSTQKPVWMVEVKWTDRPYQIHSELENCVRFAQTHSLSSKPLITSKTITGNVTYKNVTFRFQPTSVYAYTLGANISLHFNRLFFTTSEQQSE
jgi:predicted AAA+ superfamily ATPase